MALASDPHQDVFFAVCKQVSSEHLSLHFQKWSLVERLDLLESCALSMGGYPAWQKKTYGMPSRAQVEEQFGSTFLTAKNLKLGAQVVASRRTGWNLYFGTGTAFTLVRSGITGRTKLVFGGTNSGISEKQWLTLPSALLQAGVDIAETLGWNAIGYQTAALLAQTIHHQLGDVELVGHSLGGGLAQMAGLITGNKVTGFSSAPLGTLVLKEAMERQLLQPELLSRFQHFVVDGDPVPDALGMEKGTHVLGTRFQIPIHPSVVPAKHFASHGQVFTHLKKALGL